MNEKRAADGRDENSEEAAGSGEEQAFGEQLPDDATSGGAHGGAEGEFLGALRGEGEQEICNVGAGDEKNQGDDHHQDGEGFLISSAQTGDTFIGWRDFDTGATDVLTAFGSVVVAEFT